VRSLFADTGILIGDFNRTGVADDEEHTFALTLEEAMDALSPGLQLSLLLLKLSQLPYMHRCMRGKF
jgi:hypothetical protein